MNAPNESGLRRLFTSYWAMSAAFALLNVAMYWAIGRFWIGGSSFLPLVGELGQKQAFLYALTVNLGVIVGVLVSAASFKEFKLRLPRKADLWKAVLGGFLIGVGITLAPGTCSTAFVTGIPMLSVSSFLSAIGIFLGAYAVFRRLRASS